MKGRRDDPTPHLVKLPTFAISGLGVFSEHPTVPPEP
jgi:hypothetical protein